MLLIEDRLFIKLKHPILKSKLDRIIPQLPIYFILVAFIPGTLIFQGCFSKGNKNEYKTIRVTKQSFSLTVMALGTVKPQVGAEVRLGARISGKVEHLRSNIGDYVKKGQIIAELEKDELKANVEKQQAELNRALLNLFSREAIGPIEIGKAKADSSRLQAAYELEAIEYERQKKLFVKNLISEQNLDQAKEKMLVAKAELEAISKTVELTINKLKEDLKQLKAEVASARASLKIAEVGLSYATLRAPISGVIASVSTQEGETVAAGLSAPTFVTIIDLDKLQVETYVDEVDIGKIKIGQKAIFSIEAFPSIDIEGEVVGIYPKAILKENVVFYNVVIKCLNAPTIVLRPEMTANVSIFLESRPDVLFVPARSVKKSGGINFVYVIDKGKPTRREVRLGWKQGQFIEITEGLKEGDEVLENHFEIEGEQL